MTIPFLAKGVEMNLELVLFNFGGATRKKRTPRDRLVYDLIGWTARKGNRERISRTIGGTAVTQPAARV